MRGNRVSAAITSAAITDSGLVIAPSHYQNTHAMHDIKIPPRWAPILVAALMSGMMSAMVALISTIRGFGWANHLLFELWLRAWSVSWPIAFVVLVLVGPSIQRWVARHTENSP